MSNNYDLLVAKINEFTQKFYLNKLLRGVIYALSCILGLFLLLFLFTYYSNPGIRLKTILFYSYIAASILLVYFWIVVPGLSYLRLGKTLTLNEASKLIGNHFFNVKDKLLNTLQLKALADQSPENNMLILAGIDQKIMELKPVPFTQAIRLADNRKYIKYFLLPFSIILLIGIIAPAVLREGTNRFVQYDKEILPVAPFKFNVVNKSLRFTQGDDAIVSLKLSGDEIPQEVYVSDGLNTFKLEKISTTNFKYTFKNIQKNKQIRFSAGGFDSQTHTLVVNARPSILNVSAILTYPSYLKKANEEVQNVGDLLVPEGTVLTWKIVAENSSSLTFRLGKEKHELNGTENDFRFSKRIKEALSYQITPKNTFVTASDSLLHQISVIKDEFPTINVVESQDSISSKALYFSGKVSDDHGFSSLAFIANIKENGTTKRVIKKLITVKRNALEDSFFHVWNMSTAELKVGESIEYFFEVADNDGTNGAKVSRSETRSFSPPTAQEITEKLNAGSSSLKQEMEKAIKLASEVEKESKKLGAAMLDKNNFRWRTKSKWSSCWKSKNSWKLKLEKSKSRIKRTRSKRRKIMF